MKKNLSLFMLTGLIIISVDSVRNLPSLAIFGQYLPLFFIFGTLFFLIPVALISAELSTNFSTQKENGIFQWCSKAFSDNWGMFAIWSQWSSNIIWFPASLLFMSSTICSLFNIQNNAIISLVMVLIYLSIMIINNYGIKESALVSFICMVLGVFIPVLLIFTFLIFWLVNGYQLEILPSDISFHLSALNNIPALTAIIISFLGIELCSVYVPLLQNPKKDFKKSLAIATLCIIFMMLCGALTIAFIIPKASISLYNGLFEIFKIGLAKMNSISILPYVVIGIFLGAYGSAISWALSPAISLRQAAYRGFLPKRFIALNQYDVPKNILLLQGLIIICISLTINFLHNLNSFYWILISVNTEIYLTMYIIMFLASIKLRKNSLKSIIKNDLLFYIISLSGILGTIVALMAGFVIPKNLFNISSLQYILYYLFCVVFVCSLFFIFVFYKNFNLKKSIVTQHFQSKKSIK